MRPHSGQTRIVCCHGHKHESNLCWYMSYICKWTTNNWDSTYRVYQLSLIINLMSIKMIASVIPYSRWSRHSRLLGLQACGIFSLRLLFQHRNGKLWHHVSSSLPGGLPLLLPWVQGQGLQLQDLRGHCRGLEERWVQDCQEFGRRVGWGTLRGMFGTLSTFYS